MKKLYAPFAALLALIPAQAISAEMGETGLIGRWSPGIGDPTVVGWVTVAAYFAAAVCCAVASRSLRGSGDSGRRRRERAIWGCLSAALFLLGINKQLDLQSAFTELGRILAKSEGWYKDRQVYQGLFILALGLAAFAVVCVLAYLARKLSAWTKLAVTGSVLIIAYVVIRAASFHHFDVFIQSRIFSIKMNWILELGGIAVVLWSALMRRKELAKRGSDRAPLSPPTA
jgi:hypothetical protein